MLKTEDKKETFETWQTSLNSAALLFFPSPAASIVCPLCMLPWFELCCWTLVCWPENDYHLNPDQGSDALDLCSFALPVWTCISEVNFLQNLDKGCHVCCPSNWEGNKVEKAKKRHNTKRREWETLGHIWSDCTVSEGKGRIAPPRSQVWA